MNKTALLLLPLLLAGPGACGRAAPANGPARETAGRDEPATIEALPLRRGYYVASDTPCGEASNATVLLLRRNGIGGARDFCEFQRIERIGPGDYRVVEACGDLRDEAPPESSVASYRLSGDEAFTIVDAHGRAFAARYCPQADMPAAFRANDIREATN